MDAPIDGYHSPNRALKHSLTPPLGAIFGLFAAPQGKIEGMRNVLFGLAFLLSTSTQAGVLSVGYGLGAQSKMIPQGSQKALRVAWHARILPQLYYSSDAGVYFDNVRGTWAIFGFAGVGTKIQPLSWFYLYNFFGPGFITRKDDLLGGYFQFAIDVGTGFVEPLLGTNIGLAFKHISSAGIYQPNQGRNYWLLSVGWEL